MKKAGFVLVGMLIVACGRGEPEASTVAMPQVDAPDGDFAGRVEDRLAAGSYTYMLVRGQGRVDWVVTLGGGAPVGEHVDITNMGVRSDFHSKRLDRTFDRVVFAIVRSR